MTYENNTALTAGNIHIDEAVGASQKKLPVVINRAFGEQTLMVSIPVEEFIARSIVPNEHGIAQGIDLGDAPSQRPINQQHALGLAIYMLKGELNALRKELVDRKAPVPPALDRIMEELGHESYYGLSPIVANIRPLKPLKVEKVDGIPHLIMDNDELFRTIDGQHRREGRALGLAWLKSIVATSKYPVGRKSGPALYLPSDGRTETTPEEQQVWGMVYRTWLRSGFEVSIHLNLSTERERQLFYVLNNLGRAVEAGLAFTFDESNPVNQFIKTTMVELLKFKVVNKDMVDRDEGEISLKDLIAINAILFLNKTNVRSATPVIVSSRQKLATKFWEAIAAIPGFGQPGAKANTVAAQPVMLKALAKLTHDLAFQLKDEAAVEKLLNNIPKLDLTHSNEVWQYYKMKPQDRDLKFPGLSDYLPPEGGGNRDVGGYDQVKKVMNFGAKHNDIYPLLGDMIRWALRMPPRQHKTRSKDGGGED